MDRSTRYIKVNVYFLQEVANKLARLSIRACARLGGYLVLEGEESSPDNPAVKKSLSALLTPYLARKLANENPSEVWLRILLHTRR